MSEYKIYPPNKPVKNVRGFGAWIYHEQSGMPYFAEHQQVVYLTVGGLYGQAYGKDLSWILRDAHDDIEYWALKEGHRFYFEQATAKYVGEDGVTLSHDQIPDPLPHGKPAMPLTGFGAWIPNTLGKRPEKVVDRMDKVALLQANGLASCTDARYATWSKEGRGHDVTHFALKADHPFYRIHENDTKAERQKALEDNALYGEWS